MWEFGGLRPNFRFDKIQKKLNEVEKIFSFQYVSILRMMIEVNPDKRKSS